MSDLVTHLAQQALELAPADRERLVDLLLESLPAHFVHEPEPEWRAEIDRRLSEYDLGEVEAIDAADVFAKLDHLPK